MHLFSLSSKIIITCSKRLSIYLDAEVRSLGLIPVRTFQTGIELFGTLQDCIRLNLHLRCASQVLFSLHSFKSTGPDDLYRNLVQMPWEKIISADGYFSITSNVDNINIRTPLFANVKVKDAIVDRMRQQTHQRPDSGPNLDRAVFHLYWKDEQAELFADTSGETLAKHGYRKIPGKAPMMEALAAATILASKWNGKGAFVNPMCGSATIAIEAAMIATRRTPGLYRNNYSFMHFSGFEKKMYDVERKRLDEQITEENTLKIIATDLSEDAINISRINAAAAGVSRYISFAVCDFEDTEIPEYNEGVVFFNPEYGDRLGTETALIETYKRMGDFLKKKCKGYLGYIFTGNLELAKKIGLKASRRIEFFNSKIDCRLLEYELYAGTKRPEAHLEK